jgi:lysozyme
MNRIALDFIKTRESCRLTAYRDSGGVWTVGYGATGAGIAQGTVWTQEQADADLAGRVAALETSVSREAPAVSLSLQQQAALISFAYNAGVHAFAHSHLLAFVLARNWIAAAKAFLEWDHVAGLEQQGLLKRRLYEAALFLEGTGDGRTRAA